MWDHRQAEAQLAPASEAVYRGAEGFVYFRPGTMSARGYFTPEGDRQG